MNYSYGGVTYNTDSAVNQEIRRRFVEREVIYCVSYLVSEVVRKCECWDDYPHIFERLDYEDVIYDELKSVYDETIEEWDQLDAEDREYYEGPWDDLMHHYDMYDYEEVKDPQSFLDKLYENDRVLEFADDHNLEPDRHEVFEHWIVSDWLADKLEAQEEAVERDFFGLTIWGRCTTGQSIYMDGVIGRICFNLGILEGQEHSWEGQNG